MKRLCLSLFVAFSLSSVGAVDFPTISKYDLEITLSQNEFSGILAVTFGPEIPSSFLLKTDSTIQVTSCSVVVGSGTPPTCTPTVQNDGTTKFKITTAQPVAEIKDIKIIYTGKYDVDGLYKETFNGKDYYFAHFGYGIPEKIMPTSNFNQILFTLKFINTNTDFTQFDNKKFIQTQTRDGKIPDLRKFAVVAGTFKSITEDKPLNIQGTEEFKIPSSALTFASNILEKIGTELGKVTEKKKIFQILFPRSPARDIQGSHLTTQSFKNFLLDPKTADFREKSIRTALVQQLSRHWFGGEVFMEDKWLMTGLSTFFSYYFLDKLPTSDMEKKNFNALDQFILDHVQLGAFEADGFPSSLPLGRYNGINTPYDGVLPDPILYSKGASIMSSLNAFCPEGKFMNGLKEVVKKSSMKVDDFAEVFKDCFPSVDEAKKFFNSWHKNSGYPVVHVEKTNATTGKFKLTQERFTWHGEEMDRNTMVIPIRYITDDDVPGFQWMRKLSENIRVDEETSWIIINHNNVGYFRVNYDMKTWDAIISQLEKNHKQISAVDRAQIIDDVFSFARSVRNFSQPTPDYRMAFKLFNYLKNERSYIPLKAAFNAIEFLDSALAGSPAHSQLMSHVKSVVGELYKLYGLKTLDNKPSYSYELLAKEVSSWACRLQLTECIEYVKDYWESHELSNKITENEELSSFREVVLCTGIRNKIISFQGLLELAKNEKDEWKKLTYISALGCSKNGVVIRRLLENAFFEDNIYKFDYVTSILNGNSEISAVLEYFAENFHKLNIQERQKLVRLTFRKLNKQNGQMLTRITSEFLPKSQENNQAKTIVAFLKRWDSQKVPLLTKALTSGERQIKPIAFVVMFSALFSYILHYIQIGHQT